MTALNAGAYVTGFAPQPQLAPAPLARIDTDAVTRATFEANNAALAGYLRTVTPTVAPLPGWRRDEVIDAAPVGVAAPHEAHERSRRYGWTLIAIVALAIVATGGLAFTAYNLGVIPHVGLTVAIWIGAGGVLSIYLVQRLQRADIAHSPEAIALVGAQAAAFATETAAEAAAQLTGAYADLLRLQAQAAVDAQRQSLALRQAEIERDLLRLQPAPRPAPPPAADLLHDLPGDLLPDLRAPVATPVAAPAPTCAGAAADPSAPPTVAGVVLAWWLAGVDAGDIRPGRVLRTRAPWSERSELLPPQVKDAVWARLQRVEPPIFTVGAGGQFVAGNYGRQAGRAAIRGVLSDL